MPAFLCIFSSINYDPHSPLLRDFLVCIKRFGGPSVLTIAASLSTEKDKSLLAKAAVVALLLAALLPLTPIAQYLPTPPDINTGRHHEEIRNSGVIFNPNEFAAVAVLVLAIALGGIAGRRAGVWKVAAIGATAYVIVSSGSRGAMAAFFAGAVFLIVKAKTSAMARVAIFAVIALMIGMGLQLSESFKARMGSAVARESADESFTTRLDMQWIGITTGIHNPLGVGIVNAETATSRYSRASIFGLVGATGATDSIYVDYFLETGFAGLSCILLTFWLAWRLVSTKGSGSQGVYLQAGVLAAAVMGFSALSPAAVSVAPFFFLLVGLHPIGHADRQLREVMARRQVLRARAIRRVAS
jgi:hypothetical protein